MGGRHVSCRRESQSRCASVISTSGLLPGHFATGSIDPPRDASLELQRKRFRNGVRDNDKGAQGHTQQGRRRRSDGKVPSLTTTAEQSIPINTIQITPKAAAKIKEFGQRDGWDQFGLKVAVKGGGCSGLVYHLEIVSGPSEDDKVISQEGLDVYVPKKAFVFLAGTELDFTDGLNGKGFVFSNPNAKRSCGCGNSFSV